jgi:hypothetical protein
MPKNPRKTKGIENNQRITAIIALFGGKVQDRVLGKFFLIYLYQIPEQAYYNSFKKSSNSIPA